MSTQQPASSGSIEGGNPQRTATPPRPVQRPRVVVIQQVYHQIPDEAPQLFTSHYFRWLDTTEQPYQRRGTATEEWTKLDLGWLAAVGVSELILESLEPALTDMRPSPAQLERHLEKIIQVGLLIPEEFFLGESGIENPSLPPSLDPSALAGDGYQERASRAFQQRAEQRVLGLPIVLSPRNESQRYIPLATLRPGESMRLTPANGTVLAVRCLKAHARYLLSAVPS